MSPTKTPLVPVPTHDDLPRARQPQGWPRPHGYANGMTAKGRVVVTGGVVGWDVMQNFPDTFAAQARQTFSNILKILAEGGAGPEHVVRLTWYVTDLDEYRAADRKSTRPLSRPAALPICAGAPALLEYHENSRRRRRRAGARRAAHLVCDRSRRVPRSRQGAWPRVPRDVRIALSGDGRGAGGRAGGEGREERSRGDGGRAGVGCHPGRATRAELIAAHTLAGVAGISMCVTPYSDSASTTALIAAASAGVMPASPPPFTRNALPPVGSSASTTSKFGTLSARGTA